MSVRILDVREVTKPIASPIRNAYIDFSKMTTSLVAVVTNVERNGRRVVGYGFNSNGRYGQGGLIRERFAPRIRDADPATLVDPTGANLDPDRVWSVMMANEKPGGHGERSVAVGTLDMSAAPRSRAHSARVVRNAPRGVVLACAPARQIRGSPSAFTRIVRPGGLVVCTWCSYPRKVYVTSQ